MKATKILTSAQIKAVDNYTIEHESISSIELMERASEAFVARFEKSFNLTREVIVFCGTGNNGGDGLAIARLLRELGYETQVFFLGDEQKGSPDFEENLKKLNAEEVGRINTEADFPKIEVDHIVIDALFGSGLSRPLAGIFKTLVEFLNKSLSQMKIAVDIPSGLCSDMDSGNGVIYEADYTITFQLPKLSFFLTQSAKYCGRVELVEIGLSPDALREQQTNHYVVNREFIYGLLKTRDQFMHKGQAGRCTIIGGSFGKIGAVVLATRACLRIGAGLVTCITPKCGYDIMQISVPEAMVSVCGSTDLEEITFDHSFHVIGMGPGMGTGKLNADALRSVLSHTKTPMVIDADGLNILSEHKSWLSELPDNTIITPHIGEFIKLVGSWSNDFEKIQKQRAFAKKYKLVVLLKGAYTSICSPDGDMYFNTTGNPGMATGGSGDVLTGIITGLMGQGYNSLESCLLGGYLHGLSGDLYVKANAEESLIAGDLIEFLPKALKVLKGHTNESSIF